MISGRKMGDMMNRTNYDNVDRQIIEVNEVTREPDALQTNIDERWWPILYSGTQFRRKII